MSNLHDLLWTQFFHSYQTDPVCYQDYAETRCPIFLVALFIHKNDMIVSFQSMCLKRPVFQLFYVDLYLTLTAVSPYSWPTTESLKKGGSSRLTSDIFSKQTISLCWFEGVSGELPSMQTPASASSLPRAVPREKSSHLLHSSLPSVWFVFCLSWLLCQKS